MSDASSRRRRAHGARRRGHGARLRRPSAPAAPRPRSWSASGRVLRHPTPLNQLASISVPEAHQIVIQPWDRGVLGAIEKAIQKSDIGLMPNVDGTVVRLNIPPLTEERRKDLVKVVHKRMEEARVEIRNQRREAARRAQAQREGRRDRRRRGAPRAGAHREADAPLDRRGRPRRQGQGAGGPGGLVAASTGLTLRPRDGPEGSPDGRRWRQRTSATADVGTLPRHVAIIMDGNRRWARERGVPEAQGHAAGVEAIRPIVEHAPAARRRGALDLRLQPRELAACERRGRDALRAARRDHPRRDPRPRPAGRPRAAAGPHRGAARRDPGSIEEALAATAGGTG